ncbi:MAG: hypothetical protein ABSD74_20535 [Rhizomicrobium sp.]|jgi:hypothetical protein
MSDLVGANFPACREHAGKISCFRNQKPGSSKKLRARNTNVTKTLAHLIKTRKRCHQRVVTHFEILSALAILE